jgi:flagellar export protein FliJ
MRFKFRFASVLKIRRHQKKKEEQKLSTLFNRKIMVEKQINDVRAKCRQETMPTKKQSVLENRQYYVQKHSTHDYLMKLEHQLSRLESDIEEQRMQLTRALKRMRMMEKLRERDEKTFIDHVEHVEQLQQNEIAIQQFNSDFRYES